MIQNDAADARLWFLCYISYKLMKRLLTLGHLENLRMRSVLFVLALLLLGGSAANAACTCQCVDGQMQPVCDEGINKPMICKPAICKPPKPSVAPVIPPDLQGIGGTECKQAQVCDAAGKCTWQQVCR